MIVLTNPAVWLTNPTYVVVLFLIGLTASAISWVRDYLILRKAIRRIHHQLVETPVWPSVSVILPAWREASVIDQCIRSMLAVDYPSDRVEYIVVAGGPDGTFDLALSRATDRLHVLKQGPEGKGAALNLGIGSSHGEIIVTTDADCVFPRDWLKRLVGPFVNDQQIDAVGGRAEVLNDNSFVTKYFKIYEQIVARRIYASSRTVAAGENSAFRRQALQSVGMYDEKIHIIVDGNLEWKLRERGFGVFYAIDAVVTREYPETLREYFRQQSRWIRGIMQLFLRYRRFIVSRSRLGGIGAYVRYVRPPTTAFIFYGCIPLIFFFPFVWPIPTFIYSTLVLRNLSRPLMAVSYSGERELLRYLWLPLLFVPVNLLVQLRASLDQVFGRKAPVAFETKRYAIRMKADAPNQE